MFGEGSERGERSWLYFAAVLAHAAEQSFLRGAEGSVLPAGVLFPGVTLLPLKPPLQRIIHDPPGRVELGYKAIRGVRWAVWYGLGLRCVSGAADRSRTPFLGALQARMSSGDRRCQCALR